MIEFDEFKKIFNRSFWKSFNSLPVPLIEEKERAALVESVYKSIKDKSYYPSTPAYYLIKNKGKGVARVVPVFTARDYCVYYYCIIRLESVIANNRVENTFGGWSLSGLNVREKEESELKSKKIEYDHFEDEMASWFDVSTPSYSFNPFAWSKIYGDFNAKLYASIKTDGHKFYAEFDISNFYDSIRLDVLERRIRQQFNKEHEDDISLLFHFLQFWNRNLNNYNSQSVGIPQDAMHDCSRILANFYLQEYDLFLSQICKTSKATYFRYSDDQFLFANSRHALEYLIFKASKRLKAIGLNFNQEKVHIGTLQDLIKYRTFETFDKIANDEDKKDINKVEAFVDDYFHLVDGGEIEKVKKKGIHILNRALFCRIEDLPVAKKMRLLSGYLQDSYLLEASANQMDRIYTLLQTDKEKESLRSALMNLSEKTFHNYFHYQVLVFFRKRNIDKQSIELRIKALSQE